MKAVIAIVIVVMLLGAGFFFLHRADVPPQNQQQTPTTSTSTSSLIPVGWITSAPDAEGVQFAYPQELGTQYVHAQEWPPIVTLLPEAFVCEAGEAEDESGLLERVTRHEIDGRVYCVAQHGEGAAGSTYTTYDYATEHGDRVAHVAFTLRTVSCYNYDTQEQMLCQKEQESFDLDTLVDTMVQSITVQ